MTAIYLIYGLSFFTLGLAALLESRRKSMLLLGRQFLSGPPALTLGLLSISTDGLQMGLRVAARALVILVAVDSLTAAADVVEIATLFERAGLKACTAGWFLLADLLPFSC